MSMKKLSILLIVLAVTAPAAALAATEPPINIGSRRELFVDRYLIETLTGATLQLHRPTYAGIVLQREFPWEGVFAFEYVTVLKDGDRYRLYYRTYPGGETADGGTKEMTCYAESTDGIHWVKPELGLFEILGTKKNNAVLAGMAPYTHNFTPWLDARPGVPAQERFKALGGISPGGLVAFVSPDGIHWKKLRAEPVLKYPGKGWAFDSQNVAFWSESEKCYVCYFRIVPENVRAIARATSADFVHWSALVPMKYGDSGSKPPENLYTNQTQPYFLRRQIYIATPARFMQGRSALSESQAKEAGIGAEVKWLRDDCSDAVLMSTRGGDRYERTFMEAWLQPGIGSRNWVSRSNYPAYGIVPTGPAEMSLYVSRHNAQQSAHVARYTLRTDGFISVRAGYQSGQMLTRPLVFAGKVLEINYGTSAAGSIRVEIQDPSGRPIPGFALDDSPEIIGDEIEHVVAWRQGSDVSKLAGQPVRLRFVMKEADLYALRFLPSPLPQQELKPMLGITWSRGPNLPQGFQDSDGGVVGHTLVTACGFCQGKQQIASKPGRYPRGFLNKAWGLDLQNPAAGWMRLPDFPGVARQEVFAIVVDDALYCWGGFNYSSPFCYRDGYRLCQRRGDWAWDSLPALPSPVGSSGHLRHRLENLCVRWCRLRLDAVLHGRRPRGSQQAVGIAAAGARYERPGGRLEVVAGMSGHAAHGRRDGRRSGPDLPHRRRDRATCPRSAIARWSTIGRSIHRRTAGRGLPTCPSPAAISPAAASSFATATSCWSAGANTRKLPTRTAPSATNMARLHDFRAGATISTMCLCTIRRPTGSARPTNCR